MFKDHAFKVVPDTEKIDLGQGLEKPETEKRKEDLLDRINQMSDRVLEVTATAYNFLRRNYRHEERIEKALKEVDFDYILLVLKKIVRNSAHSSGASFQDFTLDSDSIEFDKQLRAGGVAYSTENQFAINPITLSKSGDTFNLDEERLKLSVVHVVIHEVIHLLGAKKGLETGFTQNNNNTALNEAMTEILARVTTRAYADFKNTTEGQRIFLVGYVSEVDCLLALMVLIAKDNQVEIESVIQAFTVSYFYDDSVVDVFSQFGDLGPQAKKLVALLQGKAFTKDFSPASLSLDEDSKQLLDLLQKDTSVMLKALHI